MVSLAGGVICLYRGYIQGPPSLYLPLDTEWQKAWMSEVNPEELPQTNVVVEVSGAVEKPGVFSLSSSSRVQDAILQAGGFSSSANQAYIHRDLALAAKLVDQQKIYIPYLEEANVSTLPQSDQGSASPGGSSGLNQVSQAQLDEISGIGEVRAQRVLEGIPYTSIEDFKERSGLPEPIADEVLKLYTL